MDSLTAEERRVVSAALQRGLVEATAAPAYLPAPLCTLLSFLLILPTLGTSLLLVPLIWVAQHDHTRQRILRLQGDLQKAPQPIARAPGQACFRSCGPHEKPAISPLDRFALFRFFF